MLLVTLSLTLLIMIRNHQIFNGSRPLVIVMLPIIMLCILCGTSKTLLQIWWSTIVTRNQQTMVASCNQNNSFSILGAMVITPTQLIFLAVLQTLRMGGYKISNKTDLITLKLPSKTVLVTNLQISLPLLTHHIIYLFCRMEEQN